MRMRDKPSTSHMQDNNIQHRQFTSIADAQQMECDANEMRLCHGFMP